jgi:hypothetical protein
MTDEADDRSRAEQIRDSYFRNGKWENRNGNQLNTSVEGLMNDLKKARERLQTAKDTLARAKSRLDQAKREEHEANGIMWTYQTDADILALALSDALEIPK